MTPEQVALVQGSFDKVKPVADDAAAIFYSRLFEVAPGVRSLFTGDIEEQGRKLMKMIGTAVAGLNNLDANVPAVQDLGRRHVAYGAEEAHYNVVGECLLYTLEKGLGTDWTDELAAAWTEVYSVLADTMKDAARQA